MGSSNVSFATKSCAYAFVLFVGGTTSSLWTVCLYVRMHELRLPVSWTFPVRGKTFLWEPCQQTRIRSSVTAVGIDVALCPLIVGLLLNVVTWSYLTFFFCHILSCSFSFIFFIFVYVVLCFVCFCLILLIMYFYLYVYVFFVLCMFFSVYSVFIVLFCALFVCKCILYSCHPIAVNKNIIYIVSYHIHFVFC